MSDYLPQNLIDTEQIQNVALDVHETMEAWLKTIKTDSLRARDIRNDKGKAIADFFDLIDKSPEMTQPADVQQWLYKLVKKKLAESTIYYRMLALSNYFEYLRCDKGLISLIPVNPVKVMMPKPPKEYNSKSVKALTSSELSKLLSLVENYALSGKPLFLRDHAILQLFAVTGRRRQEILGLTGEHIKIKNDSFLIRPKITGGYYAGFELNDKKAQSALLNYLEATGRSHRILGKPMTLWLRHDRGAKKLKNSPLTSHSFARRMKIYASEAGIKEFHIHKLRHTYAAIIAEEFSSLADTQEALGHADLHLTKVYVQRLKVTKDKFSGSIRRAVNLDKQL